LAVKNQNSSCAGWLATQYQNSCTGWLGVHDQSSSQTGWLVCMLIRCESERHCAGWLAVQNQRSSYAGWLAVQNQSSSCAGWLAVQNQSSSRAGWLDAQNLNSFESIRKGTFEMKMNELCHCVYLFIALFNDFYEPCRLYIIDP
jgi:hypothetical protein